MSVERQVGKQDEQIHVGPVRARMGLEVSVRYQVEEYLLESFRLAALGAGIIHTRSGSCCAHS